MTLTQLWLDSRQQLSSKDVHQIITFAGDGVLREGNATSVEFRDFLRQIPSDWLARYADQCLEATFDGSGFALQDLVNEIGARLGFAVTPGRYRGSTGHIGFDGIWHLPDGHRLIVEVKTSDTYSANLDIVATYRRKLIAEGEVVELSSSCLIVVGREETGGLEAQIRGSRHAWDMRLISLESLLHLMKLREEVERPATVKLIGDVLVPREYTRLDRIVQLLFSTAEDVREEDVQAVEMGVIPDLVPRSTSELRDACVNRVSLHLGVPLLPRSRVLYVAPDASVGIVCTASKEYARARVGYWFAFYPHQRAALSSLSRAYVAFGCGSEERIVLVPFETFGTWIDGLHTTERGSSFYWHINMIQEGDKLVLLRRKGSQPIDLQRYLIT
jgi:hypothetical protein